MTKTKSTSKTRRAKSPDIQLAAPRRKRTPAAVPAQAAILHAEPKPAIAATRPTATPPKKTLIADLLRRQTGASIAELMEATGWQSHSIRAVMSGLRKSGHEIARLRGDNGASYFCLVTNA